MGRTKKEAIAGSELGLQSTISLGFLVDVELHTFITFDTAWWRKISVVHGKVGGVSPELV